MTVTLLKASVSSLSRPSASMLSSIFASLASDPSSRWTLTRELRSDNPSDINGDLTGTATFQPLPNSDNDTTGEIAVRDLLYKEEGEMPATTAIRGMAGLRWSKKYIWRLKNDDQEGEGGDYGDSHSGISVWFVKVVPSPPKSQSQSQDEADYLFHEFDFHNSLPPDYTTSESTKTSEQAFVAPPTPPFSPASSSSNTILLTARGNHLCVNDMYRTAYSFRIVPETGEVVSWASRHVVKGPNKNQDIVNLYERQ